MVDGVLGSVADDRFFFFSSRRRHTRCSRDWSSDVCSSDLAPGDRSPTESSWSRLLSLAELCAVSMDSRGRNRKTSARTLAGVERRKDIVGCLLETALHAGVQLHTGDSKGRTRQAAAAIGARAYDFGCSAGDLAERRYGLDDHPALRLKSHRFAVENILDFISRTKF